MLDRGEALRKLALNLARYTGLAPLARSFVGGRGAILMLHRVTAHPPYPNGVNRHLAVPPDFLDMVIGAMKEDGYQFVSLDAALDRLSGDDAGPPFATITADDGYRDNLLEALPVLERHGAPITIYVAPGLVDGTALLWWDLVEEIAARRDAVRVPTADGEIVLKSALPAEVLAANAWLHRHIGNVLPELEQRTFLEKLARINDVDPLCVNRKALMDWSEIGRIARHPLVTIGAHTVHHVNLHRLGEDEALRELSGSAEILEGRLGQRPRHLAYPYGYKAAVGCREVELAQRAGFASAVTTRHGLLHGEHVRHLHALPRISVNGRYQQVAHIRTMLSGVTTPLANAGKLVVTV